MRSKILVWTKFVLSRAKARETYIFIFFIFVSATFWMLKTLQQPYETEIAIPLALTDVPDGVVLTRQLNDTVHVKLRDRGTTLLRAVWNLSGRAVEVPFAAFDTRQPVGTVVVSDIQKRISDNLPAGATMLGVRPDSVYFSYNRGVCRRLPVVLSGEMGTTPQYYLMGSSHTPDSVTVYAPQAMLDTLDFVRVQVDGCRRLQADTTVHIKFPERRDVKFVPDEACVTAKVDLYTEKTVRVPIVGRGFPANCKLCTFPAMVDVTFRVGAALYDSIGPEDFDLYVSFDELSSGGRPRWRVQLHSLPEGVSQPRFNPSDVEYLLEVLAP